MGRSSVSLTLVPQLHSWRLVGMRTYVKGHAPCRQGNGVVPWPLTILALTRKGRCPGFANFHKQAVLPQFVLYGVLPTELQVDAQSVLRDSLRGGMGRGCFDQHVARNNRLAVCLGGAWRPLAPDVCTNAFAYHFSWHSSALAGALGMC